MKYDPKTHKFCCLGVKANEEGLFTEDRLASHGSYLPGVIDDDAIEQHMFGNANDHGKLSFENIAWLIRYLKYSPQKVEASMKWLKDMPEEEINDWVIALTSGKYPHQGEGRLAVPVAPEEAP